MKGIKTASCSFSTKIPNIRILTFKRAWKPHFKPFASATLLLYSSQQTWWPWSLAPHIAQSVRFVVPFREPNADDDLSDRVFSRLQYPVVPEDASFRSWKLSAIYRRVTVASQSYYRKYFSDGPFSDLRAAVNTMLFRFTKQNTLQNLPYGEVVFGISNRKTCGANKHEWHVVKSGTVNSRGSINAREARILSARAAITFHFSNHH